MNFSESEAYLLSLGNEVETMKLGLENIRKLLAALGNPETKYLKVQVAGTNGKGSVCAFLNSICVEAGIKTGLYTSPHLVSITERVKIDGIDIDESEFAHLSTLVRETSEKLVLNGTLETLPTYFEQVTAMALAAFAEAKVELAILETGLGGRFDATTAANAEIAAITQIALDHQEYLGDTIEEIAAEKAAIIRADSKVVLTRQTRSVEQVLIGRCREVGVDPFWVSEDIDIKDEPVLLPVLSGSIKTPKAFYRHFEFWNMLGKHQFQNAAIAIAVAELLQEDAFVISTDEISIGLETASHPGRLEYMGNFLLDGAHNIAGANALAAYLDEFVDSPITMIFGAMKGKDVKRIAEILWTRAERLILTQPSNSRAMTVAELFTFLPDEFKQECVVRTNSVEEAMEAAGSANLVLVTGSLYLVGEVKKLLNN
ncbi:MAG: bifunctional folylpolyglutamate synthase/dihydrofolate synthase [Blastocatellia bacterium]